MMQNISLNDEFGTTVLGTADKAWREMLGRQRIWQPLAGPLIVVAPHPDDETLGAGGLIASWARMNRPVTVISVTDGEASHSNWAELGAVRRRELDRALYALGHDAIALLRVGLPDGRVRFHEDSLYLSVSQHLRFGATLVAPYEEDGHPDHDAVGRVCQRAAAAHGLTFARYPIWACHSSNPESLAGKRWGRFPLSTHALRAKARAIQCHASQITPRTATEEAVLSADVLIHFERPFEAFIL